jgi:hypothetical protein
VGSTRESVLEKKSFLVQQFLENAAEVKGEQPLSLPAGSETPRLSADNTCKIRRIHAKSAEKKRQRHAYSAI